VSDPGRVGGDGSIDEHRLHIKATGLVRDVFLNLVKHGRTSRLYGAGHHHARRFLDAYTECLLAYLNEFEVLHVEIAPDDFLWQGQPVLSKGTNAEQMTYGLYAEGARGIAIERGADNRELVKLADLMSRDWLHRTEFDDDLISTAWRADFAHVHIDVADRFTEDAGDGGDAAQREDLALGRSAGADLKRLTGDSVLVPQIQGLLRELESDALRHDAIVVMKQDEAEVFLQLRDELEDAAKSAATEEGQSELLQLDAGAKAALEQEVRQIEEEKDVGIDDVANVIFEIVRLEKDASKRQQFGRDLAMQVVAAVERGELRMASEMTHRALCLSWADLFPNHDASPFLEGLSEIVNEASIARIVPALHRQGEAKLEHGPLFTLLSSMPASAVPGLLRLGETVKTVVLRQIVADALVVVLEMDMDALVDLLSQVRGEASAVPLLALGRLDAIKALDICIARVQDPEPTAREAALRSLRNHQSKRIKEVMVAALKDDASPVRIEALRYMAVYRDSSQQGVLEALLREGVLGSVSEREARAWTQAYAHIGRLQAVPMLHAIAMGEIDGSHQISVQTQALKALIATGAPEGRRAVDEVARRHPELRNVVREITAAKRRRGKVQVGR
jgi:hypothetical protein